MSETDIKTRSWPVEKALNVAALVGLLVTFWLMIDTALGLVSIVLGLGWHYASVGAALDLVGLKVGGWVGKTPVGLVILIVMVGAVGSGDKKQDIWKRTWS